MRTATSTAVPVPVPHPKQIRDLLIGLTDRQVEVRPGDPVLPGRRDDGAVAVYVTARLGTGAVAACDIPFAAAAGGALGLVPPRDVEAAVARGVLTQDLTENHYEVMNIMASVFNDNPEAPHLKLHKVHAPDERLPPDVASFLGYVIRRLDLEVSVPGYGSGRLSIVALG